MEITNSISQIFACKSLHTIYNKIYVVHIASRCCGELCAENRSILNLQSYDNWLISLAEKMHKPHAAAFFGQMDLKRIEASITDYHHCVIYYRIAEDAGVQEYRLNICYADENHTEYILYQEALMKDAPRPLETMDELSHCHERFKFLVNQLVDDFIEINVKTGECSMFPAGNCAKTFNIYKKQIAWWADYLIVPEEREAYLKEYDLDNLMQSLRTNNGYHSATYTTISGTDRNSILIISLLIKEAYGKAEDYIYAYAQNITHVKAQEIRNKQLVDISQQLLTLSQTEPLTGLSNRAGCERLIKEHAAAARNCSSGTMLLIDIDHFKYFNDQYGHATGDFVLKFLGKALQDIFRSDDITSRWGGDEFVIFMRDVCDQKMIISRIERLRARLRQCKKEGCSLPITISIGAEIAAPEMTIDVLFDHCDKALYQVKSKGRNSFLFYSG